jgi:hypothetical protein
MCSALPCLTETQAGEPGVRERAERITRRHTEAIVEAVRELGELGLVTGPILLDFDGPVCAVFATLADSTVAAELGRVVEDHGIEIPGHIRGVDDPLEVLRFTATIGTQTSGAS